MENSTKTQHFEVLIMKELKLSELTTKQKLGMTLVARVYDGNIDYVVEQIKAHSLGGAWITQGEKNRDALMKAVKDAADYPILIMCDVEHGFDEYTIGRHNALGCAGSEELAYVFGKVTAVSAAKAGYNCVWNPVLDMPTTNYVCGGVIRSLGSDKYKVTALAKAEARGLHDGGLLAMAKHFPGKGGESARIDTHMGEAVTSVSKETVVDYYLYPYRELMKEGLLDGIGTGHIRFLDIDPEYPASLSKKVNDLIRDEGFDGLAMTDALDMMGVRARYGRHDTCAMALAAGNDMPLPFFPDHDTAYESLCECYEAGMVTEERLNEAVRRVLEAQHKTLTPPKFTELTDEDIALFHRINTDSVYRRVDDGISPTLDADGRYFFALLTETPLDLESHGKVAVETFTNDWYNPVLLAEKIKENFPNSTVYPITQFPSSPENKALLHASIGYDSVIFVTFTKTLTYVGTECLTSRITSLINAMRMTDHVSTVVHFGNPFVLEDLSHIPRVLIGTTSTESSLAAIDVLAGKYPALGVMTYDVKLK